MLFRSVVLHEAHFSSLVGEGKVPPDSLVSAVEANWGSWGSYLLDLRLCCAASEEGWALTVFDARRGQVRNVMIDGNGVVPAECRVLLAIDTHCHSYALDFGISKHLGIAAQFENISWPVVAERLMMP